MKDSHLTSFLNLGLSDPITRALVEERYVEPTPIQSQTIPQVLAGRDVVGIAQTGTGKTAAFALPMLNHFSQHQQRPQPRSCRALVLSPTRELSAQIVESFLTYGRHLRPKVALAIGGVPIKPQIRALAHGVDVLVATPGRLLDLLEQRALLLDRVEVFVLDEADRMSVSFHADEPGLDHQAAMPDVPTPKSLPTEAEMKEKILPQLPEAVRRYYERERPIELRPVEFGRYIGKKIEDGRFNVWFKSTARLPDDPAIHRCVLAYASDFTLLDTALLQHQRSVFDRDIQGASLDHALWFHRPFRADEWLLYSQDSPNMHGARGFARGLIFTTDGTLVASVAQEGLLRQRRPPVKPG